MKHLMTLLVLGLAAGTAAAQNAESQKQESQAAEQAPPPSRGPSIQRSTNGIVMIRSSSAATQAARAQAAKEAEQAKKAAGETQPEPAKQPEAPAPQKAKARSATGYSYGPNGQRVPAPVTASESNSASGGSSTQTIVGTGGRSVPYISTQEKVISKTANSSVVERRVQRYNTQGQPTREAVVREEERKLPDGAIEKITTVYEEDLNGNLRPSERTVSRESESGDKTRTVVTSERPSASGEFEVVEKKESVETRQGENAAIVETVVSRPSVNGRLTETKRERSVMEKSGNTATTETEVFERSTATGEVTLSQRTVGTLVENPDGSASETIKVYGSARSGGGASDANATSGLRLEESVRRNVTVRANGEKVETITTQDRGVADPSQLRQSVVVQKVTRPSQDGETVETHTYEKGVNGSMRPTQTTVEQVKK
jgi:hypothetical protein